MNIRSILAVAGVVLFSGSALAQSPAPVAVPAASSANVPAATPALAAEVNAAGAAAALQALQQMKAAHGGLLRKQAVTLQKLDELERSAEQTRIFTRRS